MSQVSQITIDNVAFGTFRSNLNDTLSALNTTQSGTSRPSSAVAGTIWLDTTTAASPTLKYYDGADDISLATLDHSANTVNWLDSAVSVAGLTTTATGTVLTLQDTNIEVSGGSTQGGEIRFKEDSDTGSNYTALKAGNPASNVTFTLPIADGTSGQAITTDGSGTLSFSSVSGTTINNNADNRVITGSGTANTLEGESSLTWDGSSLGVGLASPETTAHIQSASGECELRLTAASTSDARLRFGDTTTTAGAYIGANRSTQYMYIRAANSGSANLTINGGNGNVAIGSTDTQQRLYVYGSHVSDNGLVKVQTSNGSGNNDLLIFYDGNGTECGTISLDAGANSVAYNTSSDYRLKENTENITDGITRLKQLKPYKFNWKSKPDGNKVDGFYAHEVSPVVPEAILGDKDAVDEEGNIKHQKIDQSKLVPLLTSALQEAITKIETLEAENTDIKARLTALENA